MIAPWFLLAIPLKAIDFPESPAPWELDAGVRIFAQGKGLDRLYLDDRQIVGTWFDGRQKQEADHVIWLSPNLLSRWLGYLEAKEKWPAGELERRWARLRHDLGGHFTFIVRLCSMPRIDVIEQEIAEEARPVDSRIVRFLFTSSEPDLPREAEIVSVLGVGVRESLRTVTSRRTLPEIRIEPKTCIVADVQAREASTVLREDWWLRVPFGESLMPEFSIVPCFDSYPLGDYYRSTYLVRVPIPKEPLPSPEFELRAFSPSKERIAKFRLLERQGVRRALKEARR